MVAQRASLQRYYSQNGEDFLLWQLFQGQSDGFYVDIGAFDGIHLSNSYSFELAGWAGICVEPHPRYFPLCRDNRKAATTIQAVCTGAAGTGSVSFQAETMGILSGTDGLNTESVRKAYAARGMRFDGFESIELPTVTLTGLLTEHCPADRMIDFISLDTEGNELAILESTDLRSFPVRALVVEANDQTSANRLIRHLNAQGYLLARRLRQNLFFVRNRADANLLGWKRIDCEIEDTLHPMGESATPRTFRGRRIRQNDCWLSSNVLQQFPGQPLASLLDYFPERQESSDIRLRHIVNPFSGNESHEQTQQQTLESMRRARSADKGQTDLIAVLAGEDEKRAFEAFASSPPLTRFVSDVADVPPQRKLPLLFDILDNGLIDGSDSTHLVYTNIDICLMPAFYTVIRDLLAYGFDAITINRRTIADRDLYRSMPDLAMAEPGINHPGFDCFVISTDLYRQFTKTTACIGAAAVARSLLYNLAAHARQMLMLKNVHLTYHFGDDLSWRSEGHRPYNVHNDRERTRLLEALSRTGPDIHRQLYDFCRNHREDRRPKAPV